MHSRTAHCSHCERDTLQAKVFSVSAAQLLWRCSECLQPVERDFHAGRTGTTLTAHPGAAELRM